MLLGEITFVIGPDYIFVNLWGTCDSSVLQCVLEIGTNIGSFPLWSYIDSVHMLITFMPIRC
jgi:hypothetical protein